MNEGKRNGVMARETGYGYGQLVGSSVRRGGLIERENRCMETIHTHSEFRAK